MRTPWLAALAIACLADTAAVVAVEPDEMLADPALEARARDISKGLRCLVCQNQSIDDSDAPLARDLRLLVRERLQAGATDAETVAWVTARYGDFVLLRPPFRLSTAALWIGPWLLLAAGVLWIVVRRRRRPAAPAPLSDDEKIRLKALLGPGGER